MSTYTVRRGEPADLPAITALYNHYIEHSVATFDYDPFTVEERRAWFAQFGKNPRHLIFVADGPDGLAGYAYALQVRDRAAYRASVETTIYIGPDIPRRSGVGRLLYAALFDELKAQGVHRAYAVITIPNDASVAFHQAFGFQEIGRMNEVGYKCGRYHDVIWMEKKL
ncbi:MAG: GNAT family N-acetyltransferase [Alphaproteobacteria bacterium]|nr:GNAT family N-acetyltransferase [Alphaproteobacteria bacterium]